MNKQPEKKSNAPLIIIGLVLVAVVLGGWYMISGSKSVTNTNSSAANKPANANKAIAAANAPAGATPPNYAGGEKALVVVEEFADFQCPQCASTNPIMNEIKSMFGSRIKFIFRNYPLAIPTHDKAYDAAVATEAAAMQGKFWEMQNQLFLNQAAWTANPAYKQLWNDYAQKLGINVDKFTSDIAGIAAKGRVDADRLRGNGLGVNSTPTVFINGVEIPFKDVNVGTMKTLIDAELQKVAPAATAPAAPASPAGTATKK